MNLEKLKDTARKYEQKEDWRRAIDVYLKAIGEFESGKEPHPDLSLYNRVGDLYLKVNDPAAAVRSYERAADLYTEQGFLNNAIALCGKILRINPGRVQTYYKLAQIHARKNMLLEAKRNLIEYLERMNHSGELDAAFEAVKVFADHFPANQEIRMMLIDLLRAASREEEARAQVEKVATELEARGDAVGAQQAREHVTERPAADSPAIGRTTDLIFLDTGMVPVSPPRVAAPQTPPPRQPTPRPGSIPFVETTPAEEPASAVPDESALDQAELDAAPLELEGANLEGAEEVEALDGLMREEVASPDEVAEPEIDIMLEPAFEEASADATAEEVPVDGLEVLVPPDDAEAPEGFEADQAFGQEIPESTEPVEGITDDLLDEGFAAEEADEFFVAEDDAGGDMPMATVEGESELAADFVEEFELAPVSADVATIPELEDLVIEDPDNPDLHRRLGEALLLQGETGRATDEFELALLGYEAGEHREAAEEIVALLITLHPEGVRYYQKRVEYAYNTGNRDQLLEAYLDLGDALVRAQMDDKAAAVYGRVLEHEPHNTRARYGLEQLGLLPEEEAEAAPATEAIAPVAEEPVEPEFAEAAEPDAPVLEEEFVEDTVIDAAAPAEDVPTETPVEEGAVDEEVTWEEEDLVPVASTPEPVQAEPPAPPPAPPEPPRPKPKDHSLGFVDLGALIIEEEGPRDSRMKGEQLEPTGDEQRDFDDMLAQFKKGIDENLSHDDYEAHYDLGIAFKEMGLYDEAIAEFQKALRAPEGRLRTSEALGVAFFEKGQYPVAEAVLRRAVDTLEGGDDEKIGLIYWLGRACEAQQKEQDARVSYERAMAQDIQFMDLRDRINRLTAGHK